VVFTDGIELKGSFKIFRRNSGGDILGETREGPELEIGRYTDLDNWLWLLGKISNPESGTKDLRDWLDFPIESLFTEPPIAHLRSISHHPRPVWWPPKEEGKDLSEVIRDLREQVDTDQTEAMGSGRDAVRKRTDGEGEDKTLGFFGKELFRLLEDLDEGNGRQGDICLQLEARQDLKIFRILEFPGNTVRKRPAPFAHVGEWTDRQATVRRLRSAVVATLWNDYRLREESIASIRSKFLGLQYKNGDSPDDAPKGSTSSFLFDFPPLSHYILTIRSTVEYIGDDTEADREEVLKNCWAFEDLSLSLELPHLAHRDSVGESCLGKKSISIVTDLPSLLKLDCRESTQDTFEEFLSESKRKHRGLQKPKTETLLISSPHLRSAVERMAEIWQDKDLRTILLIAPPGSGKEVMERFLHAGTTYFGDFVDPPNKKLHAGRLWRRCSTPLAEASLVGMSPNELRATVFGEVSTLNDDNEKPSEPHERMADGRYWRNGLVLAARGTTVFLDEIDKCKKDIRASLLRFVEDDEVHPYGAAEPFKLARLQDERLERMKNDNNEHEEEKDLLKPRLLFAGSKLRSEMMAEGPPDFWTRIQRIIEIVHPFEIHSAHERYRCIQEYFVLFLYRALDKEYRGSSDEAAEGLSQLLGKILGKQSNVEREVFRTVAERGGDYPYMYLCQNTLETISGHVASFLVNFPSSQLSVRNLRSIVKRLNYRIRLWKQSGIDVLANRTVGFADQGWGGDRHLNRHWIWQNLHDITLAIIR